LGQAKGLSTDEVWAHAKFAIGEKVDNAADDHEGGTTVFGNIRYAVDMKGYGAKN
jgi:hypothetical protein